MKMIKDRIESGRGYALTPCLRGGSKILGYVESRDCDEIRLLLICGLATAKVTREFGREYAKVSTDRGDYNLSPCGEVSDIGQVAEICDIIRKSED